MSTRVTQPIVPATNDPLDDWFTKIVSHLQADHFLLKQNLASEETKKFYSNIMEGSALDLATQGREFSSRIFITHIINDYITQLKEFGKKPEEIYLGLSDSKILVWAVIEDDDEEMEDALLLAEAKVNNIYYDKGFYLSSTIVEKSDKIPAPPHYHSILK